MVEVGGPHFYLQVDSDIEKSSFVNSAGVESWLLFAILNHLELETVRLLAVGPVSRQHDLEIGRLNQVLYRIGL